METIPEALRHAIHLLWSGDAQTYTAMAVSVRVSSVALLLAALVGIPLGGLIALVPFSGRGVLRIVLRALMSVPTVVIGLVLFAVLSRSGPLGGWDLLYSQTAMALGQAILIVPLVASLVDAAARSADPRVQHTALTLGAGWFRSALDVLWEVRLALVAAVVTAFSRAVSEVGISMMVGGNIRGQTRNITTGIMLETGKGQFAMGIALGIVLLLVALGLNAVVQAIEHSVES